jgi:DNA-binding MarR family transcriptional regulator
MGEQESAPDSSPVEVPAHRVAFLLSRLGFQSHSVWARRLVPLGLDNRQAAMLRHVAAGEGQSQQALGNALQIPPSRIVALVDDLERRGLIERRGNPADRRVRALHLMPEGRRLLAQIMDLSSVHETEFCAGLAEAERDHLVSLLRRLAARQGIPVAVHPGIAAGETDWSS